MSHLALKPPLGLWPSLSELGADYRTGTGEQRTIAFAGDVQIALNTQTSLTIRPATDVEATFASVDAIGALTGYAPTTPLSVGVPRFVAWFRQWRGGKIGLG